MRFEKQEFPGAGVIVEMYFDDEVDYATAEQAAEEHGWFGYHPAGYFGRLIQVSEKHWRYSASGYSD